MLILILLSLSLLSLFLTCVKNSIEFQEYRTTVDYPSMREIEENWRVFRDEQPAFDPTDPTIGTRSKDAWNNEEGDIQFEKIKNGNSWIRGFYPGVEWYQYPLIYNGEPVGKAMELFPKSMAILSKHKEIRIAGYSLLMPGHRLPTHTDGTGKSTNSMAANLALNNDRGALYIRNSLNYFSKKQHELGKMIIFNANIEHYADNWGDLNRTILYIDFNT